VVVSDSRYTPRLKQALVFAAGEAARFRHPEIGSEHILLGMLREGTGLAQQVLAELGADVAEVRNAVEAKLKPGERASKGDLAYSAEASKVLELAAPEAESLGSAYVGQEHVLLALLRDEGGALAEALRQFDVSYESARTQVLAELSRGGARAKVKRYNLALPEEMFREVEQLAAREHTTVLEVIRRSVKLGLLVAQVQQNPAASLLIREGGTERQLVVL
jgi:ATP-dependent Clp protease ATP-binding subunit ClpA